MLGTREFSKQQHKRRAWPRALSVRKEDFTLGLAGKAVVTFLFIGIILTPIFGLSGVPVFENIAAFGWEVGRAICSYTDQSLTIAGMPLMVCTRCFGVGSGLLTAAYLYFYTPVIKAHLPHNRLYLAAGLAAMFVPWLVDSGLERLGLWITNHLLMYPTGFLGGFAVALAPLIFWPRPEPEEE